MPKLSADRVPAYCRHKRSGIAVVYIDGREIPLGTYNTAASREKYNAVIAEWIANGRTLPTAQEDVTILHVIAAFLKHAEGYYRTPEGKIAPEVTMYKHALKPVRQLYGRSLATDFGPLALKAVREKMIQPQTVIDPTTKNEKTRKGWSRSHANRQVGRIKAAFRWAAAEQMIPVSVIQSLETLAGLRRGRTEARETKKVRPVPESTVRATLLFLSKPLAAVVKLELLTGARGGELLQLRGCDLDTSNPVWLFHPEQHKNKHKDLPRVIHFGPQAQDIIRPFLKPNPTAYLFSPEDAVAELREKRKAARKTPRTYGNSAGTNVKARPKRKPGKRYDSRAYQHAVMRAAEKAGVPHWHPHQLRHTFATNMRRARGYAAANVLLGHESTDATEIYAEQDQAVAEKIMAEVG